MGRDNAPQERQRAQLARKIGRRASHDRILIVSEGSKTEPAYFGEIRAAYRLHTANVQVRASEYGTAPVQVVQYAHDLFVHGDMRKGVLPRAFEQIFAVFDRDEHPSYAQALSQAHALDGKLRTDAKQPVRFFAIASIPCFELWLLLHFEDVHAPLHRDEALRRLKLHMPQYEKGADDTFSLTRERASVALQRAANLAARFNARSDPEPFTAIADLVSLLTTMRT